MRNLTQYKLGGNFSSGAGRKNQRTEYGLISAVRVAYNLKRFWAKREAEARAQSAFLTAERPDAIERFNIIKI